jgi:TolB protein
MISITRRAALGALAATPLLTRRLLAQGAPLDITIGGGEFRPLSLAIAPFMGATPQASQFGAEIAAVLEANLVNSGLFRAIPVQAHIQRFAGFDEVPRLADWRVIGAEALLMADAAQEPDGRLRVRFRLFDTASGEQLEGQQLIGDPVAWRRVAHKAADAVYSRLTGETGYFDTRIVFVDETGPKDRRVKRLALMDQDGANLRYLTDGRDLVLTPRFAPRDQEILYISYRSGAPQVYLYNLDTDQQELLGRFPGMSFAPRFSPDGRQVVLSLAQDGNADLYLLTLANRQTRRLTQSPAIDTAPSFSPDGNRIVFESDRGGSSQIYVMSTGGGEATAQRISFGPGRYGTPVWSPRGDLIAFTRQGGGRFEVGVMATEGGAERVLDGSFLSEGPTWSPNGRVVAFFRDEPGERGGASIWSIDITGRNLRRLPTPNGASDPAWSPLRP